ncbi:glycosyltransferase family 4 protein [Bacteroidota bacterium]
MKILQLCNKLPYPPKDGGSIATLNLSKGFVESGNQVNIFAINTNKHYTPLNEIPEKLTEKIQFHAVIVNTDLKFSKAFFNLFFTKKPYIAERFITKNCKKELINLLNKESFDIIQIEGLYMAQYINIIRKHSRALIALRSHNIEHEIWQRTAKQIKPGIKRLYLMNMAARIKRLKLQIMNKYDLLIPITHRDAEVYQNLGNKKAVFVSQTGINIQDLISVSDKPDFPSVFHIGALDWGPNQEGIKWFIDNIWSSVTKKHNNIKFYIAGRNAPQWFINNLNKNNIEYVGEVENAYKFMSEKAIMIVPLLSGSGMRIKIIEGMAIGKTIISTSIGAEGINCINEKDIIIADTKEEFISQLEKLISNHKLFEEIGKNAVKFVTENFDNKIISNSLIDFYKSQL